MDKISVIVPVYNASQFIDKCIQSVLNQTYQNIELILINDGSKDNSLEILKKYEREYPKTIKVFTQKNQGKEVARNLGIDKATGNFIAFLDSDDWYDSDYLEMLSKPLTKNNDIVISGFKRYNSNYELQYSSIPKINDWSKFKYCSTAGKMYKVSFLKKNQLKYKKFKIGEDSYFSLQAYSKTEKIIVLDYAGYCNYENLSSVTNAKTKNYNKNESLSNVVKAIDKDISFANIDKNSLCFFYFKNLVLDVFLHKDYAKLSELINEFKENILWYKTILKKYNLSFTILKNKYEDKKIIFIVNAFIIATKLHCLSILMFIVKKVKVKLI